MNTWSIRFKLNNLSTKLVVHFLDTSPIHKRNDKHRNVDTTVNVAKNGFMTSKLNPFSLNNKQCKMSHAKILNDNRGTFCGYLYEGNSIVLCP